MKKTPMRTGEGPARRRLAEVRAAALAYDEEVQAASVAEEPAAPRGRLPSSRRRTSRLPSSRRRTNRRQKNRLLSSRRPPTDPEATRRPRSQHPTTIKVGDRVEGDFEEA